MKGFNALLALPASLLCIIASSDVYAQEEEWPYNLPRTVKYYPELEELMKKDQEARKKLEWQKPIGFKKMSGDEGEKFFLHYWDFGETSTGGGRAEQPNTYGNGSMPLPLLAPIEPHSGPDSPGLGLFGRSVFARDFKCPSGTHSCSSIGSNLCCQTGETCISTENGTACCPDGETCGDNIGACSDGYTSCPNSSNGGCCIPGAVCKGIGCVIYGTSTVTTTLPTATQTNGFSSSSSSRALSTTAASERTTTETVVLSGTGYTTTKTVTVTTGSATTCKSGFQTCPASLGGGCCPSGQACATGGCPDISSSSASSTTVTASQPVRPTSVRASSQTTTTTSVTGHCPANYYMCSAHYIGCCKVERDCDVLSCPPGESTVLVTSGVTIVESAPTGHHQTCRNGWFSCPASKSGGCCPSGYQCGITNCAETQGGLVNDTPKQAPSSASVLGFAWSFLAVTLMAGVGMIVL